ncbi:hypothetical protein C8034_v009169 [Colletotrichum sidae]|uniref:Uncharacterized protein n=1 Tax=Colletotrichum sidae TaxID=1347389 RepID=A0A4R8TIM5_9PEZI|nr:hypothetical protein C8034_v009169 [Colletotrichum sidae]
MSAQYFTPPRYYPSPQQTSSSARPQAHSAAQQQQQQQQQPSFTPAMRDRQARGKDPYSPHDSPSDSDLDFDAMDSPSARTGGGGGGGSGGGGGVGRLGRLPAGVGAAGGTYEDQRQRQFAIEILDDPEKLAMYACSRGDTEYSWHEIALHEDPVRYEPQQRAAGPSEELLGQTGQKPPQETQCGRGEGRTALTAGSYEGYVGTSTGDKKTHVAG